MGGGQGMRGNAASQRSIIVDVEFEEVEERIGNEFEGAIDVWNYQPEAGTLEIEVLACLFQRQSKAREVAPSHCM